MHKRVKIEYAILFGLLLIHLLPIWLFQYFPTQDGPSHLYNAHILAEYWNPQYVYSKYYIINWAILPNWFSHIVLGALLKVISPLWAEKIFLSFYVLMFPLAMTYFFRAIRPGSFPFTSVLLSFFFVYNFFFQMGFYNFAFSVPLYFLVMGYWWKHKEHITPKQLVLLNLWIACLYFTHLLAFGLALATIAALGCLFFFRRIKYLLMMGISLLPSASLLLFYLPHSEFSKATAAAPTFSFFDVGVLLHRLKLTLFYPLVSLHENQIYLAYLIGALLLLAAFLSDRPRLSQGETRGKNGRYLFLWAAIGFFVLYLVAPRALGSALWLNSRFLLFGLLCFLTWIHIGSGTKRLAVNALVVVALLGNISYLTYLCSHLSRDIKRYVSLTKGIERHKIVLPIAYQRVLSFKGQTKADVAALGVGKAHRVKTHLHAISYACLETGSINLANYEAELDYFPVRFRPSFLRKVRRGLGVPTTQKLWIRMLHSRPHKLDLCGLRDLLDYVAVWGFPNKRTTRAKLIQCYAPYTIQNPMFLFRRKP